MKEYQFLFEFGERVPSVQEVDGECEGQGPDEANGILRDEERVWSYVSSNSDWARKVWTSLFVLWRLLCLFGAVESPVHYVTRMVRRSFACV